MVAFFTRNATIVSALMKREMVTRFGREGLGFAWLIAEPLVFCFGVMILWSFTKPAYEHGVRLAPFVMTAYMSLILLRHLIAYLSGALQANMGLLYHRQITPLHIFTSRILLEMLGGGTAFVCVYAILFAMGEVGLPHDYLLLYTGYVILGWTGAGFALILAGIAMRYEFFEKFVTLISYLLIPVSGAFVMVAWVPPQYQQFYLKVPFTHPIEMIRAGVFGEFVETHYSFGYPLLVGAIMNIGGLLLIASARDRIETQ